MDSTMLIVCVIIPAVVGGLAAAGVFNKEEDDN